MNARTALLALLLSALLGGCALLRGGPGIGPEVAWRALEGWRHDPMAEAWHALRAQCRVAPAAPGVAPWCAAAAALPEAPGDAQVRDFFERRASAHPLIAAGGAREGLITGYYEPLLQGSRWPDPVHHFPLYRVPDDLLTVQLDALFPELEGKRVRGRVVGDTLQPYHDRARIDGAERPLRGQELYWVDDPVDAFFLQIQGSGLLRLRDGSTRALAYAQQNGHPYRAIGRDLIEMGEIAREDISLFSIRDWLRTHPRRAAALMNRNPSYVFFRDAGPATDSGPAGSLGVPLSAGRSVAVDRRVVPLGSPLWLQTTLPDGSPYRRLVFAQDTGGAIAGAVRADVFFGRGQRAERLAGEMAQTGRLYLLQLRSP